MRIVHYINQFFGQVGGESEAGYPLEVRKGPIGPGKLLQEMLGQEDEIVSTIVCGDNFFVENPERVEPELLAALEDAKADILVAGPAFNAGRYGMACGGACQIAYEELDIDAVSGMYEENPGLELYRKHAYIVPVQDSARHMKDALEKMSVLIKRLSEGEKLYDPEVDGFYQRGIRKNTFSDKTGAQRSIEMLLKKINREEFETELPMPVFEKVIPSPAVSDMAQTRLALLTSGGMVPFGNPDHLEACNCTKYRRYNLEEMYGREAVSSGEVVHGGYDPAYGNENGNRILPLDAAKLLEKEGRIGELFEDVFVTVGNGMGTDQAAVFGDEIATELMDAEVHAAIMTST